MSQKDWEKIRSDVRDYTINGIPDERHALLISRYPGSGKTTNTVEMLAELGVNFIYVAPTHEIIMDNIQFTANYNNSVELRRSIEAMEHFRARRRVCCREDLVRLAIPVEQGGVGMPIKPFCSNCPDRNSCEYYLTRWSIESSDHPSWAGVHSHIATYLHNFLCDEEVGAFTDYDVLVIEENPIKSLLQQEFLSIEDLKKLERALGLFEDTRGNNEQTQFLYDLFDGFYQINTGRDMDERRAVSMLGLARRWRDYDWKEFQEAWDSHLVMEVMTHNRITPENVPKYVFPLFNDIFMETNMELIRYHIKSKRPWGYSNPVIQLNFFHRNALKYNDTVPLPMKVIGLDGTANVEIWQRILGREVHVERGTPYIYDNVNQLKTHVYPQSSWITSSRELRSTGENLLELAKLIVSNKKPGKVLLIGTKKVTNIVKKKMRSHGLDKYCVFANYYALRSKNFLDCDTVILLMTPAVPPDQVDVCVELSNWPRDIWERNFREDEMIQAACRIRPNLKEVKDLFGKNRQREECEIFVFSGIPIFGNDVREGGHFLQSMNDMRYYLLSGNRSYGITSGGLVAREMIFEILNNAGKDGASLDKMVEYAINSEKFKSDKVISRMLKTMLINEEIREVGGRYFIR